MLRKIIQFSRMMYYNFQQFFLYKRFEDSPYAWALKRINILGPLKLCHVNSLSNWKTKFEKKINKLFSCCLDKKKKIRLWCFFSITSPFTSSMIILTFFHILVQSFCSKINKPFKLLNQLYAQFVSPSLPKNHLQ